MSDNKLYWIDRNGQQVDIDTMSIEYLRNTLKMIVRNSKRVIKPKRIPSSECNITKRFEDEAINLMQPDYDDDLNSTDGWIQHDASNDLDEIL